MSAVVMPNIVHRPCPCDLFSLHITTQNYLVMGEKLAKTILANVAAQSRRYRTSLDHTLCWKLVIISRDPTLLHEMLWMLTSQPVTSVSFLSHVDASFLSSSNTVYFIRQKKKSFYVMLLGLTWVTSSWAQSSSIYSRYRQTSHQNNLHEHRTGKRKHMHFWRDG